MFSHSMEGKSHLLYSPWILSSFPHSFTPQQASLVSTLCIMPCIGEQGGENTSFLSSWLLFGDAWSLPTECNVYFFEGAHNALMQQAWMKQKVCTLTGLDQESVQFNSEDLCLLSVLNRPFYLVR